VQCSAVPLWSADGPEHRRRQEWPAARDSFESACIHQSRHSLLAALSAGEGEWGFRVFRPHPELRQLLRMRRVARAGGGGGRVRGQLQLGFHAPAQLLLLLLLLRDRRGLEPVQATKASPTVSAHPAHVPCRAGRVSASLHLCRATHGILAFSWAKRAL
jgi:hypothetical protein